MHQIRYFLTAVRTLNFTWAADECVVSQPSGRTGVRATAAIIESAKLPSPTVKSVLPTDSGQLGRIAVVRDRAATARLRPDAQVPEIGEKACQVRRFSASARFK